MNILLIGFKHVGKSVVGKILSHRLNLPFIDLDEAILQHYSSPREIMNRRGEQYFRNLEHQVLQQIIASTPTVIALGGGTPIMLKNRKLMQNNIVIYLTANKKIVFDRIMQSGIPAFFSKDEKPEDTFNKLWQERQPIYEQLATLTITNNDTILGCVEDIINALPQGKISL